MLHRLKPAKGSSRKRNRVGRGPGSESGKTSGRGHKGQKQHGPAPRAGFEGGQMPLIRTTPKRGFMHSKEKFQILNLKDLADIKADAVIDQAFLFKSEKISSSRMPVKILGDGELKKPLKLRVHAFSKSAREKIEKAGGTCELAGKG